MNTKLERLDIFNNNYYNDGNNTDMLGNEINIGDIIVLSSNNDLSERSEENTRLSVGIVIRYEVTHGIYVGFGKTSFATVDPSDVLVLKNENLLNLNFKF